MSALPTNISNDIAVLSQAITQQQADSQSLPALQAAAQTADANLATGQAAVTADNNAVNAALAQLQADIAALEGGAATKPAPRPAVGLPSQLQKP